MTKNRVGTKLLALKLTGQFIIFGILVGYFSLILTTVSSGRNIIDNFTDQILREAEHSEMGRVDWIEEFFVNNPEKGEMFIKELRSLFPVENMPRLAFAFFRKQGETGAWEKIYSEGPLRGLVLEGEAGELWTERLEKTLEEGVYNQDRLYLGAEETRGYFLDLTPLSEDVHYVGVAEFTQAGIFAMLADQNGTIRLYTLSLVIFSLILGQIFTYPLSKSIRTLTDKAITVAKGEDEEVSFSTCRLDDVGILSRSMDEMTLHLRHRARTMETMNRIDRAVLSSLSRQELLTKVAGFVADQFGDSSVAVLERGEKDYRIQALLACEKGYKGTHLPYRDLDGSLLNPPGSPFCLDEFPDRGLELLMGEGCVKKHNFAYPLVLEEKIVGLIIVSRDEMEDYDREALRMLADQVGVALKSLTESKVREKLYDSMMLSLTRTVDAKSQWTGGHSERVTELALLLAEKINTERHFMDMIRVGGLLHDIGKLAIPEAILDKPGKLDNEEFQTIRSHPVRGYEIIKDIPDFELPCQAVRSHHERWDGKGYPDGLKGEDIPFIARIITICDVYDAVTEDRPYRKGFRRHEAREFMVKERGGLFDPQLLDAFIEMFDAQDRD